MATITYDFQSKRDTGLVMAGAGGARWAFFAIFIAIVIIVILGTLRANKKRTKAGIQPIYGTRWMTPPSYFQSQHQYNQPHARDRDPDMPNTYVPAYTETANEYDMGYYDVTGEYHPNPNAKSSRPLHADVPPPQEAHHRNGSAVNNGVVVSPTIPRPNHGYEVSDENDGDFYRPSTGAPPMVSTREQSDTANIEPTYLPPSSPPPGMTDEGSGSGSLPSFREGSYSPKIGGKK